MKIAKYILIALIPMLLVSCASWRPATDEEYQQNMHDLDMYMLSHGAYIPNNQ